MNCKKLIILLILTVLGLKNYAQNQDAEALLKKANDEYQNKDYVLAAQLYEQLLSQGYVAEELNFNLGNAYYKSENYALAILNYERAIKQNPDFEDAKTNLKFANLHLRDKIASIPESNISAVFNFFVKKVSLNVWAGFTLAFLIIGLGLFLWYFFTEDYKLKKFAFSFGAVFVILSCLTLCGGFYAEGENAESTEAVIISPVVTAKSSPDDSGTDLFRVHEGLKVSIKDKSADWIEIRISDGRSGWVKMSMLEKI
ncbi:MAG: tetratricopeptide repeat protein [Bacteroidales bacterium]|nr:tetratricopeptide repeat protein [Bacteroidales bacterium]MBR4678643.1 tetratricopeptide repeat protein [Bacteroidales bacterium]